MSRFDENNVDTALILYDAFQKLPFNRHCKWEGWSWLREQCIDLCKDVDLVWHLAKLQADEIVDEGEFAGADEFAGDYIFDDKFITILVGHYTELRSHHGSVELNLTDIPDVIAKKIIKRWESEKESI